MAVKNNYIELKVADTTLMEAYIARAEGPGRHPGIIVFQEAFGVNAYIRDIADRFAREGFTAFAPELFHRTGPGFEGAYADFPGTRVHLSKLTDQTLEADVRAAYGWLASDPLTDDKRIASVGFCMGGRVSFLANSIVPLRSAVSFYGGGIAPALLERAGSLRSPMLFFWGGLDTHIGPEQTRAVEDALRAAGKEFTTVIFSYADHGFFCDKRASYSEKASRQAWPMTLEFLRGHTR